MKIKEAIDILQRLESGDPDTEVTSLLMQIIPAHEVQVSVQRASKDVSHVG